MAEKIPLKKHLAIVREADLRFAEERDRRYAEVAAARAEALKIKEEADKVALDLARQIQVYKDEKANELREQINSERGLYVTNDKFDSAFKPVTDFVSAQQGRLTLLVGAPAFLAAAAAVIVLIVK